jgi:hypothetical protein
MIVYVDDYKIAGPPDNVREAWELIQELNPRAEERGLILDAPSPAGEFLGCNRVRNEIDGLRMSESGCDVVGAQFYNGCGWKSWFWWRRKQRRRSCRC